MSSPLTPEQKKRMEENRRIALAKRAARMAQAQTSSPNPNASSLVSRALDFPKPPVSGPGSSNGYHKPVGKTVAGSTKGPGQAAQAMKDWPSSSWNSSFVSRALDFPKPPVSGPGSSNGYHKPVGKTVAGSTKGPGKTAQAKKDGPSSSWNVMTAPLAGTLSLIAPDRFICYIGFNQKLNELFKSIPGSNFDPHKKKWTFPLDQYDYLKKQMEPLAPNITVGSLPKQVLKMFSKKNKNSEDYKSVDISKIEPVLLDSLFPFQKEGVQFGVSKNGKCLIADEMGLGKTLQALAIADYYEEDWPILVICPSSMRFQWQEEILRYLRKIPSYGIIVVTSGKTFLEDAKVVIISYDLVAKLKDVILKHKFGFLICDESHCIKSGKAVRTKAVTDIAKKAKRVLLLSGTPALSRPKELYHQFKAIAPNLFPDKMEFGVRYCDGKYDKFGWNDNGSSHLEELKVILEDNVMIRRLKADVLDQLPAKIRQVVQLDKSLLSATNKKMQGFEQQLQKDLVKGAEKRSTLLAYYAETGKAKINAICAHLETLIEQEKKFIVFAHHRDVMDGICDLLERKQTYYIRIDGAVNSEDRKSVADQFQELDKFRVAVLSITAANTGLTLTSAQMVVFAELFWNPGHLLQAEDRAHRIGQKTCVIVQYLIAKGTADSHIWPLIQTKLNVLSQAGLSKDNKLQIVSDNSQSSQSSQKRISDFFREIEDDVDENALSELMDQIDALENLDGVPEKKMKRS